VLVWSLPRNSRAESVLELMSTLVTDLPQRAGSESCQTPPEPGHGQLTGAEGHELRAIRVLIFECDARREFAGIPRA
jgi:hypothetical protein